MTYSGKSVHPLLNDLVGLDSTTQALGTPDSLPCAAPGAWNGSAARRRTSPERDYPALKHVYLGSNGITDDDLAHLAAVRALERVGLHGADITDAKLSEFAKCTHLEWLSVKKTKVTPAGPANLRTALLKRQVVVV